MGPLLPKRLLCIGRHDRLHLGQCAPMPVPTGAGHAGACKGMFPLGGVKRDFDAEADYRAAAAASKG